MIETDDIGKLIDKTSSKVYLSTSPVEVTQKKNEIQLRIIPNDEGGLFKDKQIDKLLFDRGFVVKYLETYGNGESLGVNIYEPYFLKKTGLNKNYKITEFADKTYIINNFNLLSLKTDQQNQYRIAVFDSINKAESDLNITFSIVG